VTAILIVVVVLLAAGLAALSYVHFSNRVRRQSARPAETTRRILFPFVSYALSPRALDAALRLARAEGATLVPVFLCRVSLDLPLEASLPRQSGVAIPLQEAIEQRAAAFDVPVDARIERGRTYRHALRQALANERFDRIVIAAAAHGGAGFDPDDVAWLLDNAPGEIVVLRPDKDERIGPPSAPDSTTLQRWRRSTRSRSSRPASQPARSTQSSGPEP
jgi:nucleotide-binding universal stress UspA family protein